MAERNSDVLPNNRIEFRIGINVGDFIEHNGDIFGDGVNVDGKAEARGPGSLIYEPYAVVHQWGNPGNEPLTFLAFNINPEGVAAVLPGAPAKNQ
jgi:class 3 adenylate cyclase